MFVSRLTEGIIGAQLPVLFMLRVLLFIYFFFIIFHPLAAAAAGLRPPLSLLPALHVDAIGPLKTVKRGANRVESLRRIR